MSESLALTDPLSLPSPSLGKSPTRRDLGIWGGWKSGISPEELAAREGISIQKVQSAILKVESYHQTHGAVVVNTEVNSLILRKLKSLDKVYDDGLEAKKLLSAPGPNGEPAVLEPDHDIRIKIAGQFIDWVKATQPKSAMVNIDQSNKSATFINNGGGGGPNSPRGLEQIVRAVRAEQGLTNEEVDNVVQYDRAKDIGFIDETAEEDEEDEEDEGDDILEGDVEEEEGEEEGEDGNNPPK